MLVNGLVLCVVYLSTYFKVDAVPFYGMDDSCILSFVVPKEKIKSSCELDEKVNRRINAMETKVNIYKQQVNDLQTQLDKQRQLNGDKLTKLEQQIKDISVHTDMSFLVERRLALLEKELEHLQSDLSAKVAAGKIKSVPADDKTAYLFFNTIDNNSVTLSNQAKSLIQFEMNSLLDNFTKKFETYVQEQVLLYSKEFNMLPKRNEILEHSGGTFESTASLPEDTVKVGAETITAEGEVMKVEAGKADIKLNDIDDKTEKPTGLFVENITGEDYNLNATVENINVTNENINATGEYFNVTDESVNITTKYINATEETQHSNVTTTRGYDEITSGNLSKTVVIDGLFETNDSFVDEFSENNMTFQINSVTSLDNDISKSATSRINSKSEKAEDSKDSDETEDESHKNWKEDMIRDQHKQADNEDRIKEEITSMLSPPLAEVMSLIEKQKISLEEKIKIQDQRYEQMNKDLTTHVKELDGSVHAITLQMESLSKGFQDSFSGLDKIKPLEILVHEIKKNMSTTSPAMSALGIEEQSKKIKKLERLMVVYQQSLEHYRNETKQECREMKDSLEKDTTAIKTISKTLQNNLTTTLSSELSRQNNTFLNKIQEITEQLRMQDESLLLLQLDLGNVEKTLNSRATRWSDRDMDKMQEELNQMAVKQRDFKKKLEHIEQTQSNLTDTVNVTVSEVSAIKMEVKLNLDEWIPFNFEFDSSRTDCFGDQYVKRTKYAKARLVGVVLCSPKRYKIFLSPSLRGKFLNIGDGNGLGEDHCEFVGGTNGTNGTEITLSPYKSFFGAVQGYARNNWGEKPTISYLNNIKPTPHWYECNVQIP